jgi:sugar phosphate isomerase/epimerase
MQVAYQTIIWGPYIDDLEGALSIIASAGYQGVEFAQRPERLGRIENLLRLLQERNLALIGLAGGTLQERMEFCGSIRPLYLYVEDWDPSIALKAVSDGFTLALHPHVFKKVRCVSDAKRLFAEHKELKWLPDTAHLRLAGDDPREAIACAIDRLAAVHLKDWTPEYGRSYYRYSRGFTELGRGIIPLTAILDMLETVNYAGWLVVEQDSTRTDPQSSALESAQWLAKKGIIAVSLNQAKPTIEPQRKIRNYRRTQDSKIELRFARAMMRASTEEIRKCYGTIVAAFNELIPCDLVTLWGYDSARDRITLLMVSSPKSGVTSLAESLFA